VATEVLHHLEISLQLVVAAVEEILEFQVQQVVQVVERDLVALQVLQVQVQLHPGGQALGTLALLAVPVVVVVRVVLE
jgi:hypothetical protein